MPVLEVVNKPEVFECRIEDWLQSAEEKQDWLSLITAVVQYAYLSRPATLITLSPMQGSIGHWLSSPRKLRTGRINYLVNEIEHCYADLLVDIAESEDFQRGLLWFTSLTGASDTQLLTLIGQVGTTSPDPKNSSIELLLLLDDARQLTWLNPSRNSRDLETEMRDLARKKGWKV